MVNGREILTFMSVYPGTGYRMDRNNDGILDGNRRGLTTQMFKLAIVLLGIIEMALSGGAQQMSSIARSDLAPMGQLRVGINFGNALLANKDRNGVPDGIAVS